MWYFVFISNLVTLIFAAVKKLIIIENDTDIREMLVFTFENNGYEVIRSDKELSVQEIAALRPNVIVVGYHLKEIAGNNICVKLKADEHTGQVPVILYSATVDTDKISRGSCADGHIGKPYGLEDLVYLVHRLAYRN